MKTTHTSTLIAATFLALGAATDTSHAAIVIDISQVGSDVYMVYTGSINLTDLTLNGSQSDANTGFVPTIPFIELGAFNVSLDRYSGTVTGDGGFGTGGSFYSTPTATGDHLTFQGDGNDFRVPAGYVSGSPLSGDATYVGQTLSSFGLIEGVYTYQWGSGANQDSVTINIVPEPASAALLGIGLIGFATRRKRSV